MDIEKLIEQLRYLADTPSYTAFHDAKEREIICDQCEADFCYDKQQDAHWCMYEALSRAATALSTLQAENEKLKNKLSELAHLPFDEPGIGEQTRLMAENAELRAELEQKEKYYEQMVDALAATESAELEQVKLECDAAQSLLAEQIGVRGAEPITTAFGLPLDRLRVLAQADREGRCVVLPAKTVFELTWDAGPECDMACPVYIDGAGECGFCDKGQLFVYERQCKQEHIERIGEDVFLTCSEAEAALKAREQDG